MKNLLILTIMSLMFSNCTTDYQLTGEDKNEILKRMNTLNELFQPENDIITYSTQRNRWEYFDGTEIFKEERLKANREKLNKLKLLNICTDSYASKLEQRLEKDNINWGILLMNHEYGDHLIKVLPEKDNIYQEYDMEVWEGDEEMLAMSDEEFASFLKERIEAVSSKKAYMKIPYSEISILYSQNYYRDAYNVLYYFIKNKQNQWLLDDIKVEKEE